MGCDVVDSSEGSQGPGDLTAFIDTLNAWPNVTKKPTMPEHLFKDGKPPLVPILAALSTLAHFLVMPAYTHHLDDLLVAEEALPPEMMIVDVQSGRNIRRIPMTELLELMLEAQQAGSPRMFLAVSEECRGAVLHRIRDAIEV